MLYNSSIMKWIKSKREDEFIFNLKRFHKFGIITIIILNLLIIIVSIIILVIENHIPRFTRIKLLKD